ncbi:MAG: DNA modification methylase [Patescibacteria group bacterium]|nr:ParB N-terminal domain-containing protein [Patescibacteria group bacterium]MDE2015055.1 DNA modification methylase [Patescibacteria group bacterium]MDE2226483.1 DNA modification methylase [Patescibacteria group bacterium]
MDKILEEKLHIEYVPIANIRENEYNPKTIDAKGLADLEQSIVGFGIVDPLILNSAPQRKNVLIGGHQRLKAYRKLGYEKVPCVYVNIPDLEREKELCIRLSKNVGEFDFAALAEFDEGFLKNLGFTSEELDDIFQVEDNHEVFDLQRELEKLDIASIEIQKGDVYDLDGSRAMCGDSTIEADMLKLMGGERADMCFTDPPYILHYLRGGKRHGKPTEGFGYRKDRKYLGTDELPPDFTERWMDAVAKVQKPDFSIIVFENPKNLRTIWNAMEKHWRYRNTITWHVPNRVQNFSAKYKFFNKTDIAVVGTGGDVALNLEPEEDELLQNEYENALFMTSGKPAWESYEKGKKICPTDYIEHVADDAKHSGQNIVFGTKPLPLLIPYLKVLTHRGDLVLEPFCGSGSTLIAATKMKRRCFMMEKSPVYLTVAIRRWEKLTGRKAVTL